MGRNNEPLNTSESIRHLTLTPTDNKRLAALCGQLDEHLRLIEYHLGVEINNRGYDFEIIGSQPATYQTCHILERLYQLTAHHRHIHANEVLTHIQEGQDKKNAPNLGNKKITSAPMSAAAHIAKLKPRTDNQKNYLNAMQQYDINFAIGPSGTGKTFIAVACAVEALEKGLVDRLILTRPAVEAGEKLGYLPGNLSEKIDPYLRPLYDALQELLKGQKINQLIENGIIEILPLAYMRGRTLNNAFIILDEAQNSTQEQMKMFLTRIGFGSKAVITGDITQTDLPKHIASGLRQAVNVLKDIKAIRFTFLTSKDIVRHPVVQDIIEAYEKDQT